MEHATMRSAVRMMKQTNYNEVYQVVIVTQRTEFSCADKGIIINW